MAGRKPTEIDPLRVEELAAEGFAEYQIAQGLGVCWNTFNARRKENPEIDEALKRGQQAALGKVENALYASAIQGNLGAQVFYLKNRSGGKWRDKTEQVTHLRSASATDLTNDELLEIASGAAAPGPRPNES